MCNLTEPLLREAGLFLSLLTTVLLEVSDISRPAEQNELPEKNFTNAESKSSLLSVCGGK